MDLWELGVRSLVLFYFAWVVVDLAEYFVAKTAKNWQIASPDWLLWLYRRAESKPFNCHICMVFWLSPIFFIPLWLAEYLAVVAMAALLGGLMMKLRTLVL